MRAFIQNAGEGQVQKLNNEHCHREKLFRMCAGCSSKLIGIDNGIFELEIRISDRALADEVKKENVISGLIDKWEQHYVWSGYRAHIYRTYSKESGFMIPAEKLFENGEINRSAVSALVDKMRDMRDAEWVDVKIEERCSSS